MVSDRVSIDAFVPPASPAAARAPRVLHIGKYLPPYAGGMENFLGDLLPALQRQGVEVGALVHAPRSRSRGADAGPGDIGFPVFRAPTYGRLLYAPISPLFGHHLNRALRRFRPDILHLHLPNTSAFWVLASPAARRLPWIVHWHSDVVPSDLRRLLRYAYRVYRPFERALLARTASILVTSPPYLEASPALAAWRDRCEVVPLGLAPQRILPTTAADLAWARGLWGQCEPRVLAVGRLTYYKGYEHLIHALAAPDSARLLIVGAGELAGPLRRLIDRLGLRERVRLLGYRPEGAVNALFETCEVFCLSSVERTEAFGVVLLEAMCHERAVVASDIPGSGVGWVVGDGGRLVPPGDRRALRAAFEALADDPAARSRLAANGRRRFVSTFHIDRVSARIAALYQEVILGGKGPRVGLGRAS